MLFYLYKMSNLTLFIFLSVLFIGVSVLLVCLVRRYLPNETLYKENPVIGNISSLISIIYGVLVGLTALYLINNLNYTADAVQREANAVANIYRDSKWLKGPAQLNVQTTLRRYLNRVVEGEWPLMENGKGINNEGNILIEQLTNLLVNYPAQNNAESLLVHDMFDEIKSLYDARHQRIHMSYSALNNEMWAVIIIGTIMMIIINYLFGMNFYLHLITVSAVALMAASMIFLLVALDRPFQGEFIVAPSALTAVLKFMDESDQYKTKVAGLAKSVIRE